MRTVRLVLVALMAPVLVASVAAPAFARIKFVKIQYESPGPDTGSNDSLNGEYVVIKNTGAQAKRLRGWKLEDKRTAAEGGNIDYHFGTFRLGAGKTVKIHTGRGSNTRRDLYWGRSSYVWGDDSDTAYLYKKSGALADKCAYVSHSQQTSPPASC